MQSVSHNLLYMLVRELRFYCLVNRLTTRHSQWNSHAWRNLFPLPTPVRTLIWWNSKPDPAYIPSHLAKHVQI